MIDAPARNAINWDVITFTLSSLRGVVRRRIRAREEAGATDASKVWAAFRLDRCPRSRGGAWAGILLLLGNAMNGASAASTPRLESTALLDIAPGPGNPRNSEGAFVDLRDGGLLFVYSHFVGDKASDHAKARLAARVSRDGGATWSEDAFIAIPGEDTAMNVMSVSLLRLANGDLGLFYLLRKSWHDLRMYLRRSSNEGHTWGEPLSCMPASGYYVVNNDRVVRLNSGRLVIPAALHRKRTDRDEASALDWRGIATFFLSDDDGGTWREAANSCTLPVIHTRTGLQEPGVIELQGGMLWGWARTDLGRQYEFFSWDGGETWTLPAPSRFTSPNSPLSMKRIPGTDQLLAVWNPAPAYETRAMSRIGRDRTPLVAAVGRNPTTWSPAWIVEGDDGVDAGYHYVAIHFGGDAVLLAYCAGGEADKGRLNRLRIRRVKLEALRR
jgi:hypothetical protein